MWLVLFSLAVLAATERMLLDDARPRTAALDGEVTGE